MYNHQTNAFPATLFLSRKLHVPCAINKHRETRRLGNLDA